MSLNYFDISTTLNLLHHFQNGYFFFFDIEHEMESHSLLYKRVTKLFWKK